MPSFPSVTLLDSFKRATEEPLSNGGKWSQIIGTGKIGNLIEEEYQASILFEPTGLINQSGAWWNPTSFVSSPGVCVEVEILENRLDILWACLQSPTTETSGYQLYALQGVSGKFGKIIINKYVKGTPTQLYEVSGEEAFSAKDKIGLSVAGGKVYGWLKKGAGSWTVVGEVADATYTGGYVGLGGSGTGLRMTNFEAGEATEEPELTNPGTQTGHVGKEVKLKIVATHTEEYKATGLPEGLSINSSTGEITGTPTKEETVKVKLKVKGAGGEASDEFEWKILKAEEGGVNVTFMILS